MIHAAREHSSCKAEDPCDLNVVACWPLLLLLPLQAADQAATMKSTHARVNKLVWRIAKLDL